MIARSILSGRQGALVALARNFGTAAGGMATGGTASSCASGKDAGLQSAAHYAAAIGTARDLGLYSRRQV